MEDNFDYQAYLRNNPLLKENKGLIENTNDTNQPGPGSDSPHKEESPDSIKTNQYKQNIKDFILDLNNILKSHDSPGDEAWSDIHDIIYQNFPANYGEFNKMWDELRNVDEYEEINTKISYNLGVDINDELNGISYHLELEDDMNESKNKLKELVKKTLKEMSVTGGGGAGASFSAGVGMNYSTPKAFNKLKKKK